MAYFQSKYLTIIFAHCKLQDIMGEQQPVGIIALEGKINKIDGALVKANRVSQIIGTPEFGRPELDISSSSELNANAYLDTAIRVGRVRQALAENAIPKLNNSKDEAQRQIGDIKDKEQNAQKLAEITALIRLGYLPNDIIGRAQGIWQTQAVQPVQQEEVAPKKEVTIDELGFSTSTSRGLRRAGIKTLGQLLQLSRADLSPLRGVGENGAEEIEEMLREKGMVLAKEVGILQTQAVQPVQQEIDDRQAQQILDGLSPVISETSFKAHAFYRQKLKKLGFTSARVVARKVGISLYDKNNHLLAVKALRKAGIPIRIYEWISYPGSYSEEKIRVSSILFARDEERAAEALVKDQDLKGSLTINAQLVCGEYNGDYPKVYQVQSSLEYESPMGIFIELGINAHKLGGYSAFLTPDCPVPIFRCGETYHYFKEHKKALKSFLETRARELGILTSAGVTTEFVGETAETFPSEAGILSPDKPSDSHLDTNMIKKTQNMLQVEKTLGIDIAAYLKEEYEIKGRSLRDISKDIREKTNKAIRVLPKTVNRWLKICSINNRSRSEARKLFLKDFQKREAMVAALNTQEAKKKRLKPEKIDIFNRAAALNLLTMLEPKERQLLEARYNEYKRLREIGIEFDVPISTARHIVEIAISKLRKRLNSLS